jgi:hypothetical protein
VAGCLHHPGHRPLRRQHQHQHLENQREAHWYPAGQCSPHQHDHRIYSSKIILRVVLIRIST